MREGERPRLGRGKRAVATWRDTQSTSITRVEGRVAAGLAVGIVGAPDGVS